MSTVTSQRRIVSAAFILGAASLGSRLVGLIRDRVLTTTFGAGMTLDAFMAAFRLPDLIFNLVVVGALSAAFIPLFTEKLVNGSKSKHDDAFEFSLSVLHSVLFLVAVLSGMYALLAPWLVPWITPGFSGETLELTIQLSRVMALQPIFLSISFVFSGVLNSFQRFAAYALAPIVYNIGIIAGVLLVVPMWGTVGLAWGVVLGAVLHMLVQWPSVRKLGWRWRPAFKWSHHDLQTLRRMIVPRVVGLAGQQANLFVVTVIGSTLVAGSISVFNLANNIQSLPVGIFGLAFAQAAFPTLAEQISRRQRAAFRHTLTRAFRYILFFIVPTSVFFFLLRAQIVRVLFGDGKFDWEDTILTFDTLGLLLISLFAQATVPLLVRAFYVQQDTRTPVLVSLLSIVINIGLAIFLAPMWGVQGLALAFSAAAIVQLVVLLAMLHWQLEGFDDREVLGSLFKIMLAALVAGLLLQGLKYPVAMVVDMQRAWGVLVQLVVTAAGGLAAYIGLCLLLRCDELEALWRYVPRRFRVKLRPGLETSRFGEIVE